MGAPRGMMGWYIVRMSGYNGWEKLYRIGQRRDVSYSWTGLVSPLLEVESESREASE